MKRLLACMLCLALCVSMGASFAVAEGEKTTITFWHSIEEAARQPILALLDEFMAQNPDIVVVAEYQGSYSDSNKQLLAAVAASEGLPGVHQTLCTEIATYAQNGILTNLDTFIEAEGFPIDEYAQGMVEAYQYDGALYGLPSFCSVCPTIYYNKTVAQQEGIVLPQSWDEWDEFVRKATIKDENGNTVRYAATFAGWGVAYYGPIFWANGVQPFLDEDQMQCGLGSDEALKVYEMLKSWVDGGYIKWGYGTNASTNMRQSFMDGSSFAVFHTSAMYSSLYAPKFAEMGIELGVAFPPAGTAGQMAELGGSGLTIPQKLPEDQKAAAWRLIKFLTSGESSMTIVKATGYLPTSTMATQTQTYADYVAENPELENLYMHLDEIRSGIINPCWGSICTLWQDAMAKVFNEGAPLEATISQMVEEANELLEDQ